MKSEYIIDTNQYVKTNHIEDDIAGYVKNEISDADRNFMFFVYCILH